MPKSDFRFRAFEQCNTAIDGRGIARARPNRPHFPLRGEAHGARPESSASEPEMFLLDERTVDIGYASARPRRPAFAWLREMAMAAVAGQRDRAGRPARIRVPNNRKPGHPVIISPRRSGWLWSR